MEDFNIKITIPSDDEGYILLQCPICGTYFKITSSDIKDNSVFKLYCPSCGLTSDNYITQDVIDLGMKILKNKTNELIYNEMKKLEKRYSKGNLKITSGKKPTPESIEPIHSGIEALEIVSFDCCKRTAKIKPILKMTGCYCPFCGVKNYELE